MFKQKNKHVSPHNKDDIPALISALFAHEDEVDSKASIPILLHNTNANNNNSDNSSCIDNKLDDAIEEEIHQLLSIKYECPPDEVGDPFYIFL